MQRSRPQGRVRNTHGTNAYLGQGEWMVVEADESDGTFIKLPSTVAVVTNIDPEHLDHYGDFDTLRDAFRSFVEQVPFYGFAVLCIDHPEVQSLLGRVRDRRVVTYGMVNLAIVGNCLCAAPNMALQRPQAASIG